MRQQGAELPFGEGLQAGVVAQQVEQAAQAKVGQAVEGPAVGLPDGYVGDLLGLQEASPYVSDRLDHRTRGEDEGSGEGLAQVVGERGQGGLGERAGRQGEQDADPVLVQRADQGGKAGLAAGGGGGLGQLAEPGELLLAVERFSGASAGRSTTLISLRPVSGTPTARARAAASSGSA